MPVCMCVCVYVCLFCVCVCVCVCVRACVVVSSFPVSCLCVISHVHRHSVPTLPRSFVGTLLPLTGGLCFSKLKMAMTDVQEVVVFLGFLLFGVLQDVLRVNGGEVMMCVDGRVPCWLFRSLPQSMAFSPCTNHHHEHSIMSPARGLSPSFSPPHSTC